MIYWIKKWQWWGFGSIIRGGSVRIWYEDWDRYWYGFQLRVSFAVLISLLIVLLLLITFLVSFISNPVDIKTESRASRISRIIARYPILCCTDIIDSDNPPPPPPHLLILILPPPHLLNQSNIIWYDPLISSGPIPYPSSFTILPPPVLLCDEDN